ncbi:NnrS family protein [Rheinheimera sp. F8]|uniref:NnrS family protein n=1 Tax=Rheinheimera sp. F8 TaxID=1763998 RepID=UPI0007449501|nr:NnrS family protein [Rheinheimera sp. F8]ALZ74582.1 hypothetical protein ATY27_01615 [Rheinheimera sp. F8]
MLRPDNLQPTAPQLPLLAMPFRPAFLLAGIWAVVAISIWLAQLSGVIRGAAALSGTLWHVHEMLFGFGALVAIGFLLTAAQNWTQVPALNRRWLLVWSLLWLSARVLAFTDPLASAGHSLLLLMLVQSSWWLLSIGALSRQLWRARSRRNYQFLLMLTGMALLNLLFLQQSAAGHYLQALHLGHSMILLFAVLMGVLGGRVIPFFTARATNTPQPQTPRLDLLLLVSAVAGALGFISSIWWSWLNPGWLMLLVAMLHLLRLGYWFTPKLLTQPLLWSLHVANLALACGLALMAIALLSTPATLPHPTLFKDALHLVGISAMAGMMLAMMARVALGHTGRPLQVSRLLALAFAAVLISGLLRAGAGLLPQPQLSWYSSAGLWLGAFAIFTRVYWPILTSPRLDGRPG